MLQIEIRDIVIASALQTLVQRLRLRLSHCFILTTPCYAATAISCSKLSFGSDLSSNNTSLRMLVYRFLNPLGLVAMKWAAGKEMLGYL